MSQRRMAIYVDAEEHALNQKIDFTLKVWAFRSPGGTAHTDREVLDGLDRYEAEREAVWADVEESFRALAADEGRTSTEPGRLLRGGKDEPGGEAKAELVPRGVIDPTSSWKMAWDLYVSACVVYLMMLMPYAMGFKAAPETDRAVVRFGIGCMIDVTFVADMVLCFATAFPSDSSGRLITDRWRIGARYIRSAFFIDFVSTFSSLPTYVPRSGLGFVSNAKLLRIVRLSKLFKLARVMKLRGAKSDPTDEPSFLRSPGVVSALQMLAMLYVIAHFMACGWYGTIVMKLQEQEGGEQPGERHDQASMEHLATWVNANGLAGSTTRQKYVAALYWAFTTMTTVGYGDVAVVNNTEKCYAIGCMILGGACFGYIIGNVTRILENLNLSGALYSEKMDAVKEYLYDREYPPALGKRVKVHFKQMYARLGVFDTTRVMVALPVSTAVDLVYVQHRAVIDAFPLFRNATRQFVVEVVPQLLPCAADEGEFLFFQGEIGTHLYFIESGAVQLIVTAESDETDAQGDVIALVGAGEFCGEAALLETFTNAFSALVLDASDFYTLPKSVLLAAIEDRRTTKARLQHSARKTARAAQKAKARLEGSPGPRACTYPDEKPPPSKDAVKRWSKLQHAVLAGGGAGFSEAKGCSEAKQPDEARRPEANPLRLEPYAPGDSGGPSSPDGSHASPSRLAQQAGGRTVRPLSFGGRAQSGRAVHRPSFGRASFDMASRGGLAGLNGLASARALSFAEPGVRRPSGHDDDEPEPDVPDDGQHSAGDSPGSVKPVSFGGPTFEGRAAFNRSSFNRFSRGSIAGLGNLASTRGSFGAPRSSRSSREPDEAGLSPNPSPNPPAPDYLGAPDSPDSADDDGDSHTPAFPGVRRLPVAAALRDLATGNGPARSSPQRPSLRTPSFNRPSFGGRAQSGRQLLGRSSFDRQSHGSLAGLSSLATARTQADRIACASPDSPGPARRLSAAAAFGDYAYVDARSPPQRQPSFGAPAFGARRPEGQRASFDRSSRGSLSGLAGPASARGSFSEASRATFDSEGLCADEPLNADGRSDPAPEPAGRELAHEVPFGSLGGMAHYALRLKELARAATDGDSGDRKSSPTSLDAEEGEEEACAPVRVMGAAELWKEHGLFHPECGPKVMWDVWIGVLIMYSALSIFYVIAFGVEPGGTCAPFQDGWAALDAVLDVCFGLDVLASFNTARLDDDSGHVDVSRGAIAREYARGWLWVDLPSTLPIDRFVTCALAASDSPAFRSVKMLRILRLVRLAKIQQKLKVGELADQLEEHAGVPPALLKLVKPFVVMGVVAHFFTCFFMYVGRNKNTESWLDHAPTRSGRSMRDAQRPTQYLTTLYWAFATMTTVGYGDVTPALDNEAGLVATIVSQVLGTMIFAYVIGILVAIVTNLNPAESRRCSEMAYVGDFLRSFETIPADVALQVKRAHRRAIDFQGVFDEASVLSQLPPHVRSQCVLFVRRAEIPFLRCLVAAECRYLGTLALVVPKLQPYTFARAQVINSGRVNARELHFLLKGKVTVEFAPTRKGGSPVVEHFAPKSHFGEATVLIGAHVHFRLRCKAIATSNVCNTLTLAKSDYEDLRAEFPELVTLLDYEFNKGGVVHRWCRRGS